MIDALENVANPGPRLAESRDEGIVDMARAIGAGFEE
jgi:hypothetical protein